MTMDMELTTQAVYRYLEDVLWSCYCTEDTHINVVCVTVISGQI